MCKPVLNGSLIFQIITGSCLQAIPVCKICCGWFHHDTRLYKTTNKCHMKIPSTNFAAHKLSTLLQSFTSTLHAGYPHFSTDLQPHLTKQAKHSLDTPRLVSQPSSSARLPQIEQWSRHQDISGWWKKLKHQSYNDFCDAEAYRCFSWSWFA
jgi:hypothetical protein